MAEPGWASPALWLTAVAVFLAAASAITNYYLFRTQVDPLVIVYLIADDQHVDLIKIVIENIGKGLAKNVSFKLSEPLPDRALEEKDRPNRGPMTDGPLINGIPALGPGSKRVWTWGTYEGLRKAPGGRTVTVQVYCESDRVGVFNAAELDIVCPIEIRSFAGTDSSSTNWERKSARQLELIAQVLRRASTGFQPLKIEARRRKVLRKRAASNDAAEEV